jgi:hypothetical protein
MNPELDWTAEEIRRYGHAAVEALAESLETMRSAPVRRAKPRQSIEEAFSRPIPEQGMPFEAVLQEAVESILPHTMRVNHPRFFRRGGIPGSRAERVRRHLDGRSGGDRDRAPPDSVAVRGDGDAGRRGRHLRQRRFDGELDRAGAGSGDPSGGKKSEGGGVFLRSDTHGE